MVEPVSSTAKQGRFTSGASGNGSQSSDGRCKDSGRTAGLLSGISWCMRCTSEVIARMANADEVSTAEAKDVRIEHGQKPGWLAPVELEPKRKKVREKCSSEPVFRTRTLTFAVRNRRLSAVRLWLRG